MFFNRKNIKEELELFETDILNCADSNCKGWMRTQFATSDFMCPLCGGETKSATKMLPTIEY